MVALSVFSLNAKCTVINLHDNRLFPPSTWLHICCNGSEWKCIRINKMTQKGSPEEQNASQNAKCMHPCSIPVYPIQGHGEAGAYSSCYGAQPGQVASSSKGRQKETNKLIRSQTVQSEHPKGNPRGHRENMQTPHREDQTGIQTKDLPAELIVWKGY